MGRLIAIEGIDGAGKRTMTSKLTAALEALGAQVARRAFPRYGEDVHADLIRDGLHGRLGGFNGEVYGMAMLYALDRRAAVPGLRAALARYDIVLVDRYLASNAAFGAARLGEDATGEFVRWVRAIEIDRFELPLPHAQLLLRVPVEVAASRSAHRERTEADRGRDTWEADAALQTRTAAVYDGLADADWLSPWHVIDGTAAPDVRALAATLTAGMEWQRRTVLPDNAVQAIRTTISLLVEPEYETLERMIQGRHLTAAELAEAVQRYGRTLVRPPAEAYGDLEPTETSRDGKRVFLVEFPLWTEEEGQSDLELDLTVVEVLAGIYTTEINGIRVF